MKSKAGLLISSLIVALFCACSQPSVSKKGTIVLQLPSTLNKERPDSRAVNIKGDECKFKITISDDFDYSEVFYEDGGTTYTVELEAGKYNVEVAAYYIDDVDYESAVYIGREAAVVKPEEQTEVTIKLYKTQYTSAWGGKGSENYSVTIPISGNPKYQNGDYVKVRITGKASKDLPVLRFSIIQTGASMGWNRMTHDYHKEVSIEKDKPFSIDYTFKIVKDFLTTDDLTTYLYLCYDDGVVGNVKDKTINFSNICVSSEKLTEAPSEYPEPFPSTVYFETYHNDDNSKKYSYFFDSTKDLYKLQTGDKYLVTFTGTPNVTKEADFNFGYVQNTVSGDSWDDLGMWHTESVKLKQDEPFTLSWEWTKYEGSEQNTDETNYSYISLDVDKEGIVLKDCNIEVKQIHSENSMCFTKSEWVNEDETLSHNYNFNLEARHFCKNFLEMVDNVEEDDIIPLEIKGKTNKDFNGILSFYLNEWKEDGGNLASESIMLNTKAGEEFCICVPLKAEKSFIASDANPGLSINYDPTQNILDDELCITDLSISVVEANKVLVTYNVGGWTFEKNAIAGYKYYLPATISPAVGDDNMAVYWPFFNWASIPEGEYNGWYVNEDKSGAAVTEVFIDSASEEENFYANWNMLIHRDEGGEGADAWHSYKARVELPVLGLGSEPEIGDNILFTLSGEIPFNYDGLVTFYLIGAGNDLWDGISIFNRKMKLKAGEAFSTSGMFTVNEEIEVEGEYKPVDLSVYDNLLIEIAFYSLSNDETITEPYFIIDDTALEAKLNPQEDEYITCLYYPNYPKEDVYYELMKPGVDYILPDGNDWEEYWDWKIGNIDNFEGWYTDSDCTEGPVTEISAEENTTNRTFYAKRIY